MTGNSSNGGALTAGQVAEFDERFRSDPKSNLMQNVVTRRDVNEVALDHSIVREAEHTFSTRLDDWGVTNQARSGRCWMFAGLNMFRVDSKDVLNLKEFEFSQNYVMFWDKLERANFLLEAIIETADRPWTTGRWRGCCPGAWRMAGSGICSSMWCGSTGSFPSR